MKNFVNRFKSDPQFAVMSIAVGALALYATGYLLQGVSTMVYAAKK